MSQAILVKINNSKLIKSLEYDGDNLKVNFHDSYFVHYLIYEDIPHELFEEMCQAESQGKFYLKYIKPNFTHKLKTKNMEQPKGINVASDKKRFLKMRIDVMKLNKDWFFVGKDGAVYADVTLLMLPDGEVDKYENLGMIVQDVPKDIYMKDKKAQGAILGNAKELEWAGGGAESAPGSGAGTMGNATDDDLPF